MNLDAFYEQHHEAVWRFILAMVRDQDLADDLVQEAFMKAMAHQHLLEELATGQQRAWLITTARNLAMDQFRFQRRHVSDTEIGGDFEELPAGDFERMLKGLPEHYVGVLRLRYEMDMNSQEIARHLQVPAPTVRRRLQAARALVRQNLERNP